VTGNMNGFGNTRFDLFDEDPTGTSDQTEVTVGGNVDINDNSSLQINNTARLEATGHMSFWNGTTVNVAGCGDATSPCTSPSFSALRANGADGIHLGQYSRLGIHNGGAVTAQKMNAGPFVTLNLDDSDLAIGNPVGAVVTPGSIDMFAHNVVFWNDNTLVTGNINAGAYTLINAGGAGGQHQGNINMSSGISPGVLSFFTDFTIDGNIDCGGDPNTVITNGNTITFTSGGFINC